jgi:cytochrome c-type biogenesis protein
MNSDVSVLLAFAAGVLSFLSPCVLPLIPSWLCLVGGISIEAGTVTTRQREASARPRVIAGTILFVLGFSTVFIVLSMVLSRTFLLLSNAQHLINRISGIVIIVMGVHVLFNLFTFLNYEKRFHPTGKPRNLAGCFITGAAFGTGWTPCIGPILTSILFLAAQEETTGAAVLYLAVYSLGLGLPFVLAALFLQTFLNHFAAFRRVLPFIQKISGAFLIVLGVWVMAGGFRTLNVRMMRYSNRFVIAAQEGSPAMMVIPAAIYLLIALLPPVIALFRRKKLLSLVSVIVCCLFSVLFVLQVTGVLNSTLLVARLIEFTQNF